MWPQMLHLVIFNSNSNSKHKNYWDRLQVFFSVYDNIQVPLYNLLVVKKCIPLFVKL